MTGMYTNDSLNMLLECISSAYLPHRSKGSTWTTRLLLETKEITCMLQKCLSLTTRQNSCGCNKLSSEPPADSEQEANLCLLELSQKSWGRGTPLFTHCSLIDCSTDLQAFGIV